MINCFKRVYTFRVGLIISAYTVIALATYGIPIVLGNPILRNSNLIQNYPLRALVGIDLAHGHLPLWNPYIWSGTPLLAGFNAGAAYPLTWLFAVLPAKIAWVVNQASGQVVAAVGMLVYARLRGRCWWAGFLAGLAYGFGGFIVAQNVHIGLVLSAAWLPWCIVALDRLAYRPQEQKKGWAEIRSLSPWVALLAASFAMMILAASPGPILDSIPVIAAIICVSAIRVPKRRYQIIFGAFAALCLSALASSVQWLPGALFQASSQRKTVTYAYFTSGSFPKGLTFLGVDPVLVGSAHSKVIGFLGSGGLQGIPEISFYVGIGAAVAVFGLLSYRYRHTLQGRERWLWYGILMGGLLLAFGSLTPLSHLEYLIPFYNTQRMLNRNLMEVDLALAVLLADWTDIVLGRCRDGLQSGVVGTTYPTPSSDKKTKQHKWVDFFHQNDHLLLPALPIIIVVILLLLIVFIGSDVIGTLGGGHSPVNSSDIWRIVLASLIPFAVGVGWWTLYFRAPHWRRRRLGIVLVLMTIVDLGYYGFMVTPSPMPNSITQPKGSFVSQLKHTLQAETAKNGSVAPRIVIYDPLILHLPSLNRLGQPDLTLLQGLQTAGGYGALVERSYQNATDSHSQLDFSPSALAGSLATALDIGVLITLPQYFLHRITVQSGSTSNSSNSSNSSYLTPPPPTQTTLSQKASHTWFFGSNLTLRKVVFPLLSFRAHSLRTGTNRSLPKFNVGLLSADSASIAWLPSSAYSVQTKNESEIVHFFHPVSAAGIAVRLMSNTTHEAIKVGYLSIYTTIQGSKAQAVYRLDGSLIDSVTSPHWYFAGEIGAFSLFRNSYLQAPVHIVNKLNGQPVQKSSSRVIEQMPWGTTAVEVNTPKPALLVRSATTSAGWTAALYHIPPNTDRQLPSKPLSYTAEVHSFGLLQAVSLPKGHFIVVFRFFPQVVKVTLFISVLGWFLLALLVGWQTCWILMQRSQSWSLYRSTKKPS